MCSPLAQPSPGAGPAWGPDAENGDGQLVRMRDVETGGSEVRRRPSAVCVGGSRVPGRHPDGPSPRPRPPRDCPARRKLGRSRSPGGGAHADAVEWQYERAGGAADTERRPGSLAGGSRSRDGRMARAGGVNVGLGSSRPCQCRYRPGAPGTKGWMVCRAGRGWGRRHYTSSAARQSQVNGTWAGGRDARSLSGRGAQTWMILLAW